MKSSVPTTDSVICIHPVLEERGTVKNDEDTAVRVSLKDCLACSGCAITEDDINLLAHQDPTHVFEVIRDHPGFSALISTSAIANLAASRDWTVQKAYTSLRVFLRSLGASHITHDGFWQNVWRHLLLDQFRNNENLKKPLIISRCAGAVMFFERKTKYAHLLAPIKPFPQLYAIYQKMCSINGSSSSTSAPTFVMNVAPCYDRKLETGRFEGEIDAVMTIGEIDQKINLDTTSSLGTTTTTTTDITNNNNTTITNLDEEEFTPFPVDNDAFYMIKKLSCAIGSNSEVAVKESGHTVEYTCGEYSAAYICGEAALRRLCANIDRNRCKFDIVEADLCPNACATGGGLIRGSTPSKRKELVAKTTALHNEAEKEAAPNDDVEIEKIIEQLKKQPISTSYVSEEPKKDDFNF